MYSQQFQTHRLGATGSRLGLGSRVYKSISAATYRMSGDGLGRRKTESLLDNVEAAAPSEEEDRVTRLRRRREERRKQREQALSAGNGQPDAERYAEEQANYSNTAAAAGWNSSEWGPQEPLPPEYNEYGWADDSWSDSAGQRSRRNGNGAAGAAWDEELEQRQRRQSGAFASTSAPRTSRRPSTRYAQDEDVYEDTEQYDEDGTMGGKSPRSRNYQPDGREPDIALLSPQELERVLPVVPFSAQATYFNGGAAQSVQRWGASLALTVLLSKVAVLAASTLTWPLWWPWAQAASKNYSLRKQSTYAGLWRTQILEVEARGRPRPQFGARDGSSAAPPRFSTMRTTRIVFGDPEGAQTEFVLPADARYDLIQPGQPAELIVLSNSPSFESFKAVKDVYLPDCGLWLSEYPYLDRTEFLELSLEVEREAMTGEHDEEDQEESYRGRNAEERFYEESEYYGDDGDDEEGPDDEYYSRNGPSPPRPPPRY